ncbi:MULTISPECIES: FUSC family protein [unclassified Streptomyces]|uniref:FUSC family protein n=1 Tax=unclassified Streptomyces TaxID=2593676 RepID=UPI001EF02CB3|nr:MULTISPECIES: FUSC family protein [unclassified Streptomyces]
MRRPTRPRPSLRLRPLPPWLGHALRAQRAPVPWPAVVRGALAAGPLLLLAILLCRPSSGVLLALGAMLAGVNDRPGPRLAALTRLGGPALAGGLGMVVGTLAGSLLGTGGFLIAAAFTGLGLVGGAFSAVGPVASACGTQLLVTVAIGAGMPLPEAGWLRGVLFAAGAAWLIVLRVLLPSPARGRRPGSVYGYLYDGERAAVAAVYDAVAGLLDAAGGPHARARRAALTAALDQAQDALRGDGAAARRLRAQYVAALPLAEAATALAWAGKAVPERACEGPRRLAAAVRSGSATGPLPAPARYDAGLRALDEALLRAAEVFDGGGAPAAPRRRNSPAALLRKAAGPAGREYGLRVGLSFGASAAVAQALHPVHWYWLPATAVFLVKPDLGPLASRVLCRAAGTVAGAAAFAGLAALLPRPAGLVVLVALCGALIPVATRHFAAQTAVVTVLVLSLVMVGGEPQASVSRITETLLACAIVLIAGHLPGPGTQRGGGVRVRVAVAREAAHAYVRHVLSEESGGPQDRARRWALRREAYRTLAQARAAVDLAAAELPVVARHSDGARQVTVVLERLVDTTTACAVQVDDTGRVPERHAERIGVLLAELAA